MAETARHITADRLSERLPGGDGSDELAQLAAVFNETLGRLERSFGELRRFTADASHELRTPLTALRSVGEVGLAEARDGARYREVIGSMLEEVDRLTRLVEGLLLLARSDRRALTLERSAVDLVALGREVAELLGPLAEDRGQEIAVAAPGPIAVDADRPLLRQAVINLVHNAIEHGPERAPIRVVCAESGDAVTLSVIDRGPGIPPEARARIFDRFFRVDEARSRTRGGTGLGLAIARSTIEAHGGRLELITENAEGTAFRLTLPGITNEGKEP